MSKFTKQAKIKDRQAAYWMEVCHTAIALFPDVQWKYHKTAVETICGLLANLAERMKKDEQLQVDADTNAQLGIIRDRLVPYSYSYKRCGINCLLPFGHVGEHSMISTPEGMVSPSQQAEIINGILKETVNPSAYEWFTSLDRDPTTKTPICDVCHVVMPMVAHDDYLQFHQWIEFHFGHPRPVVEECGATYGVATCTEKRNHKGNHVDYKQGSCW